MQIQGQKPHVLIYQDYVHNNGQLYHALISRYGFSAVGYCDATAIIAGILDPTVNLFVMPGGADLNFCEKLNGPGNRAIRNFVENGGSYLGICGGAYYACQDIVWAKGLDHEIIGPRELKFYSGTATGPIPEFMQGMDHEKSWLGAASIFTETQSVTVCYQAGPIFAEPQIDTESVIARYTALPEQPPAIVESQIGKGRVILSSPHIERLMPSAWGTLYSNNNHFYDHMHKVYKTLSKDSEQQHALWLNILDRLILPPAITAIYAGSKAGSII
jgi:glutamine amidotransferase-like uncharacterized protein